MLLRCFWLLLQAPLLTLKFLVHNTITTNTRIQLILIRPHKHGNKLQPKVLFGLGQFNFEGDISDTRNNGLIGRTGMQFGLSANINDFFDANLIIEEGIVRVEGINHEDLPENFMST